MRMAESIRGTRERSPKQEYLKQECFCVWMSGGGPSLYRRGGASDSTNLDAVNGFDERQLLGMNHSHQLLVTVKTMILQSSLSMFIVCFNALNSKTFSHLSTSRHVAPHLHVTSRHIRPRLATPTPSTRRGERAHARVWFTDLLLPASQVVYTGSTL